MRNLICRLFHRLAWPQQDDLGDYRRCIDCGRRIPIDLGELHTLRDPRPVPAQLTAIERHWQEEEHTSGHVVQFIRRAGSGLV